MVSGVMDMGTPADSFTAGEEADCTIGRQVPKENEVRPGMYCVKRGRERVEWSG